MINWNYPKTVDEAVERLLSELPLKDKVYIASLDKDQLYLLHISLASHIRQDYGLGSRNKKLIQSCRVVTGDADLTADKGLSVIIEALWSALRETHALRVVKEG